MLMTVEQANKIIRVLATDEQVFGLEIDSLLRQGGNSMTAGALFRALNLLDFESKDFPQRLSELMRELCQGDPSVLIGFDDGRWVDLPEGGLPDGIAPENTSSHYLRLVYTSDEASFYLFHSARSMLEGSYVVGGARKREGAVHHVRVDLSHPSQLQHIITRARECPHLIRVEESSEEVFWSAASQNPGY